jgi:hypothetical protein
LQYRNAEQNARIQQLEQALANAGQSLMPPPTSEIWSTNHLGHYSDDSVRRLEVMRPSPDPETHRDKSHQWQDQLFSSHDDISLGESYHRSNSLSVSDSERATGSDNRASASPPLSAQNDIQMFVKKGLPMEMTFASGMEVDGFENKPDLAAEDMRW